MSERKELYHALALAAKTRQDAFNESCRAYKAHTVNNDLSDDARREAFILSALFLSMAKAARMEAEVMLEQANGK